MLVGVLPEPVDIDMLNVKSLRGERLPVSKQILANHVSIEDAYLAVKGYIEILRSTQHLLQDIDSAFLATWEGKGQVAFAGLSNENHAMLKAAIDKTEALNQDLSVTNQTIRVTDKSISEKMGGH